MKSFLKIVVVLGALSIATSGVARADEGGFFIEPGLLYQVSDTDVDYPDPSSDSEADMNGFGVLTRLGFHINEMFFAGADLRYNWLDFKDSNSSYDVDAESYNVAPFVGLQFPDVGFRVWGAYIVAGAVDPSSEGNFDTKFDEANGFRLGTGFRVHAVSINLEYERIDYDGASFSDPLNLTADVSQLGLESNAWIASLTFPIEI